MPLFIYLFFFGLFSASVYASDTTIYKTIDAQGNVHFSDKANENNKPIEIKINNVFAVPNKSEVNTSQHIIEKKSFEKQKTKIIAYQANINYPRNDMALRSNNGELKVQVKISPNMLSTQKLQLYIDGVKVGKAQHTTTITQQSVGRGTHLLQVYLIDKDKQILHKSPVIRMHLLRANVKR
ncbi:hypothetical protein PCNPT3_01245 [Psychromonas sp. CNPT3]|uniref:DUF4124 domain-containing protein n=1 Tax=Psychromonas sp. CNPT3 TaxID=314282 RepID=UPI00006E9CA8|nr:DUF4124 domain-containing protein [Psychromonas sp. CNPT3]AGH80191.1 hypothetical protein PCNPT3_01245 [Psychromonas sp. CNPT3]